MILKIEDRELNFPDILILGAAKSGTTSLAFFLKQHPDVFMPRKEPGFFAYHGVDYDSIPSGIRDRQITDLKEYTDMYRKAGSGRKICDASVAQFTRHRQTIENIRKFYGDRAGEVPMFVILRQPVERAFSHYLMFVKNELEELPFEEAIKSENVAARIDKQLGYDYLGGSMYAERVRELKEAFPHLTVYLTSDLRGGDDFLREFLERCDLRTDVSIDTKTRLNPSGMPKKKGVIRTLHRRTKLKEMMKRVLPDKVQFRLTAMKSSLLEKSVERVKIDPDLKARLTRDVFGEDIAELEKIIGRDLSSWKSPLPAEMKV